MPARGPDWDEILHLPGKVLYTGELPDLPPSYLPLELSP